jgi:hypothetical protein
MRRILRTSIFVFILLLPSSSALSREDKTQMRPGKFKSLYAPFLLIPVFYAYHGTENRVLSQIRRAVPCCCVREYRVHLVKQSIFCALRIRPFILSRTRPRMTTNTALKYDSPVTESRRGQCQRSRGRREPFYTLICRFS